MRPSSAPFASMSQCVWGSSGSGPSAGDFGPRNPQFCKSTTCCPTARLCRPRFLRGARSMRRARMRGNIFCAARVVRCSPFKEADMNRHVLGGMIAAVALWPALAGAQTTTVIETTGAAPPDEVVTYVQRERIPSVRVQGDIGVGFTVPNTVELRAVPRPDTYS